MQNTISSLLSAAATFSPASPALLGLNSDPITFKDLLAGVEQSGREMRALGLRRTDRIAIVLPNGAEMCACFLSVSSVAASAPLNPAYSALEFEFYLQDLAPAAMIVSAGSDSPSIAVANRMSIPILRLVREDGWFRLEGSVAREPSEEGAAAPGDIALLLHTSGSTSRPKLVPLTHANLCHSAASVRDSLALAPGDRCLNVMPLFHIHGLVGAVLSSMTARASVVCTPGFHPLDFLDWVAHFQPTWYTAVPTMHQAILGRLRQIGETHFPSTLRMIRSCSSALPPKVMAGLEQAFGVPVLEAYGMTEASHQMAICPLPPQPRKPGSVGRPTGCDITVVGEDGSAAPPGQPGHILIRGAGVTPGYADNPEANEASFTEGWFRTGDQGYFDSDGYLFLTGRTKEIINRGGEKISPREIDEVLMAHPAVAQAMAFALPDSRLGEDVGALVVLREPSPDSTGTVTELRYFAAQKLADFKVPRRILFVDELPKGPTGKPQRIGAAQKLGLLDSSAAEEPGSEYVAPNTGTERRVAMIWQEVLRLDRIGTHDEFLNLGGDSILAAQVIARVRDEFRVELPAFRLFDACTIANLSADLDSAAIGAAVPDPIRKVSRNEPLPLSPTQQRMWFLAQMEDEATAYVAPTALRLKGPLRADLLQASLQAIVDRHEVLRTTYRSVDGEPVQVTATSAQLPMSTMDLRGLPPGEQGARITQLAQDEVQRGFDLASEFPLRAQILKLDDDEHVLLATFHHIASDGWSKSVFFRELANFYDAFVTGRESSLEDLPIQYADYAAWCAQAVSGKAGEELVAYWKERLKGAPAVLDLPADRPRSARQTFRGATERRVLAANVTERLRTVGKMEGATLFMLLLAGFQAVLSRYSGQTDICVGTPIAHRVRKETEGLIGFFVNTLVMRADLSGNPGFRRLLARVRQAALEAYEHQSMPFERLIEVAASQRSLSHAPLVQVMFQLRNFPEIVAPFETLKSSPEKIDAGTAPFDLTLDISESRDGLVCELNYNVDLFDPETARRFLEHYETFLAGVAENPDAAISELPILTEPERHKLLIEWNQTAAEYAPGCAHQRFEAQAAATPDAIAGVYEGLSWTYAELNRHASLIARGLQARGVKRGHVVAICVDRSLEMLAALLGIWKLGAAYLPLDPSYPPDRIGFIIQDADPVLLLTEKRQQRAVPDPRVPVLFLEDLQANDTAYVVPDSSPEDLAYILYTSGSTGKPKGVAIRHRSLSNLLESMRRELEPAARDTLLALTTISFDISILELFLPLVTGARVVIGRSDLAADGRELANAIVKSQATIIQATPVTWQVLFESGWTGTRNLKIVCGGEALPGILAERLVKCGQVWNAYGPTETTIWSTIYQLRSDRPQVRIGRPLANTQVYVLDAHRQPVPIGVPGELYIAGDGVAAGYWRQPELTAERFVPNPFATGVLCPDARMYRTGDLVRYLPDGNIEFIRRIDQQVKIRGFRIELGEIESILCQHPAVRAAAVAVIEPRPGEKQLVAYHTGTGGHCAPERELRDLLKSKLPAYMTPAAFIALDELPLTANGKVDRKALPSLSLPEREPAVSSGDMIETILTHIWEDVLRRRPIAVDDNFFDLGGHSLLGARLLARIERTFSERLALVHFFEAPTVGQMAELLRQRKARIRPSRVIPVHSDGTHAPIFVLGLSPLFRPLILRLSEDQPVFGLSLADPGPGQFSLRVEDIAARYIEALRECRPRGPYVIAGWCLDGVFAYEVAQQLSAAGEEVPLTVMFDTSNPTQVSRWPFRVDRLEFHLAKLARISFTEIPAYCIERLRSLATTAKRLWWRTAYKWKVLTDRRIDHELRDLTRALTIAASRYVPRPYQGTVLLVRPKERPAGRRADCASGWHELVPNLQAVDTAGNHVDMFQEPNVEQMASKLEAALRDMHSPSGPSAPNPPAESLQVSPECDPEPATPLRVVIGRMLTAVLLSILLFYFFPTLIEIALARHIAPRMVYVLFGNLIGCAAIAIFHRRAGIALYLVLGLGGMALLDTGAVAPSILPWLTDAMPTAVISVMIAAKAGGLKSRRL